MKKLRGELGKTFAWRSGHRCLRGGGVMAGSGCNQRRDGQGEQGAKCEVGKLHAYLCSMSEEDPAKYKSAGRKVRREERSVGRRERLRGSAAQDGILHPTRFPNLLFFNLTKASGKNPGPAEVADDACFVFRIDHG